MRTRVVYKQGEYMPQKKDFFWWDYFTDRTKRVNTMWGDETWGCVSFGCLEDAVKFCESQVDEGVKWESKL